jgi:hypothetical protein
MKEISTSSGFDAQLFSDDPFDQAPTRAPLTGSPSEDRVQRLNLRDAPGTGADRVTNLLFRHFLAAAKYLSSLGVAFSPLASSDGGVRHALT